jgi:hypothetical protein
MNSIHQQFSEQFYRWEKWGRGWNVFDEPIAPEPPFLPFQDFSFTPVIDDGHKPTLLSSFIDGLSNLIAKKPPPIPAQVPTEPEPDIVPLVREKNLIEFQTTLPGRLDIPREIFQAFLSNLVACSEPLVFELLGAGESISAQFVAHPLDASLIRRQLVAYFPDVVFTPVEGSLSPFEDEEYCAVAEFGLEREFLYPIAAGKIDPFVGIVGALSELNRQEAAVFQVIFQPCQNPWAETLLQYVEDEGGRPRFVNKPELVGLAEAKTGKPLFGTVLRIAAKGDDPWEILRNMAGALRVFAHPNGNALIPLTNDEYFYQYHMEDLILRQSRRSGMLLNADELTGLVHIPSVSVKSTRFKRQISLTKPAPATILQSTGLILGTNVHAGATKTMRLAPEQRTRHMHLIGASGTGKSTLLFSYIKQDIENGQGIAVLDPHGDLIDRILSSIPENRINDVVLVDPSDPEYSVGFNILSAHSDMEKALLASDLVSVFERLSTTWGDQMESVLNNAILAFLESNKGGTLADLQRFLIEPAFRNEFLTTVEDSQVLYYWKKAFLQLTGNRSIGPVITRLGGFLERKPIRHMVSQKENKLDFAEIMDSGKIFLAKLSQGQIGDKNAYLLGSFFVSKFQQAAMSRQAMAAGARRDFWLYIDEFHNFITPSMSQILSGARKYRLGLILAHQELRQLQRDPEVASAALSNPYTRICFRVGDEDARKLQEGFASFDTTDIQQLPNFHAICRVERADFDFNLTFSPPTDPDEAEALATRTKVIQASREKYSTLRSTIEAEQRKNFESTPPKETKEKAKEPTPPEVIPTLPEVIVPDIPEAVEVKPAPVPVRDPGRGGEQHKAIQKRLKEVAEGLGYMAATEYELADKSGSVDLALLLSGKNVLAVEIGITTTIDHELGNIQKCLKAEFPTVAWISSSETRLTQMRQAVAAALGPELSLRVLCLLPDPFIEHLRQIPQEPQTPEVPKKRKSRGREIKVTVASLTPEELKAKEAAGHAMLAKALKRKP